MLALGVAFLLGCTLAMNVTFPVVMLMYAVFVGWGRVGPAARRLAPARGIA